MLGSILYRKSLLYELTMVMLYGRYYTARYQAIADLVPAHSSVLDLCCGPGVLYERFLRRKGVHYTGLDVSQSFVDRVNRIVARGRVWDVAKRNALPPADYVIMQGALYQFLPEPGPVVERMLEAARKQVIIAEPVRNLADSNIPLANSFARHFTRTGNGASSGRFTEVTLDLFFNAYMPRVSSAFLIPGGREKVFVLDSATKGVALL